LLFPLGYELIGYLESTTYYFNQNHLEHQTLIEKFAFEEMKTPLKH